MPIKLLTVCKVVNEDAFPPEVSNALDSLRTSLRNVAIQGRFVALSDLARGFVREANGTDEKMSLALSLTVTVALNVLKDIGISPAKAYEALGEAFSKAFGAAVEETPKETLQ